MENKSTIYAITTIVLLVLVVQFSSQKVIKDTSYRGSSIESAMDSEVNINVESVSFPKNIVSGVDNPVTVKIKNNGFKEASIIKKSEGACILLPKSLKKNPNNCYFAVQAGEIDETIKPGHTLLLQTSMKFYDPGIYEVTFEYIAEDETLADLSDNLFETRIVVK